MNQNLKLNGEFRKRDLWSELFPFGDQPISGENFAFEQLQYRNYKVIINLSVHETDNEHL